MSAMGVQVNSNTTRTFSLVHMSADEANQLMPHWYRGLFTAGHLQVARREVRHLFRHTACWEEHIQ